MLSDGPAEPVATMAADEPLMAMAVGECAAGMAACGIDLRRNSARIR